MMDKISKKQFIANYAERARKPKEAITEHGFRMTDTSFYKAVPCDCDYELCEGWGMELVRDE